MVRPAPVSTPPAPPQSRAATVIVALTSVAVAALLLFGPSTRPEPLEPAALAAVRRDLGELERAMRAHAKERRAFPKELEDLVPAFLPALPRDPQGRSYELRFNGATAYVWYLGPDGALRRYPPDICAVIPLHEALR